MITSENIIGMQIEDMKVIKLNHITKNHVKVFEVECVICGNRKLIQYSRLKRKQCTKHNNKKYYIPEYDEHIGETINDYTIIKRLNRKYKTEHYYLAKCNICGITYETTIGNFKKGYGTKHTECTYHIPKDDFIDRFRKIYSCMRYRTTNPNYNEYYLYGGRGISSDYYKDFMVFYNELYESYKQHVLKYGEKDTSIDRIDPNGNYEHSNVRWATLKEQANNKRRIEGDK